MANLVVYPLSYIANLCDSMDKSHKPTTRFYGQLEFHQSLDYLSCGLLLGFEAQHQLLNLNTGASDYQVLNVSVRLYELCRIVQQVWPKKA